MADTPDDLNAGVTYNDPNAAQQGAFEAPQAISTAQPVGVIEPSSSNLGLGLLAGLGLGLVASAVYVILTLFSGLEILYLAILIGLAVAFGITRVGKSRGVLPAVLAALITGVLFLASVLFLVAGWIADEASDSFFDVLGDVVSNASEVFRLYFEDPLAYVWMAAAVIVAFVRVVVPGKKGQEQEAA